MARKDKLATSRYNHEWYEKNKEKVKEYNLRYGKKNRERILEHKRVYYQANKERIANYAYLRNQLLGVKWAEQRRQQKALVLTYYGNGSCACVKCGEERLDCLSIDHIEGAGNEHKRGLNIHNSTAFYRWLISKGYPSGYQTLCMNCQSIKEIGRRQIRFVGLAYSHKRA